MQVLPYLLLRRVSIYPNSTNFFKLREIVLLEWLPIWRVSILELMYIHSSRQCNLLNSEKIIIYSRLAAGDNSSSNRFIRALEGLAAQGIIDSHYTSLEPFEGAVQGAVDGTQSGTLFLRCSVSCTLMRCGRRNKIRNSIVAEFRRLHL